MAAKYKAFELGPWDFQVGYVRGCKLSVAQKRLGSRNTGEGDDTCIGKVINGTWREEGALFIWIHEPMPRHEKIKTLVHEAMHVTCSVLEHYGHKIEARVNECEAYTIGKIVAEGLKFWKL